MPDDGLIVQGSFFPAPDQPKRGALLPSATCEWATPAWLYDPLHREFNFTVDVAAATGNAKCPRYHTRETNGLAHSWAGERVWCNPPYDVKNLTAFAVKAWEETRADSEVVVVLLVPVKTDQAWWHQVAIRSEVRFIRGRVAFGGCACTAPMPVAVVVVSAAVRPRMVSLQSNQVQIEVDP